MLKFLKANALRDPQLVAKYVAKLANNFDPGIISN